MIASGVGRSAGSAATQERIKVASPGSTPTRSILASRIRMLTAVNVPAPKGGRQVATKPIVTPSAKTSASGPTLHASVVDNGAFSTTACYGLFAALAEGLTDIHQHGVCHRDLKPQNVILAATGPQLIDFGIARGTEQVGITQIGHAVGTPGYTAPEIGELGTDALPAPYCPAIGIVRETG